MKRLRPFVQALPGLVLILGLLAIAYVGSLAVAVQVAQLDPNVGAALVAAVVAVFGYLYSAWQAKKREIAEAHRAAKVEVYNGFFDIIESLQKTQPAAGTATVPASPDPELVALFAKFTRGLIAWGGPNVIVSWLKFRSQANTPLNALMGIDDVLRAIRKDLGNSNWSLKRGDLVKCFLKDPAELDTLGR